MYFSKVLDKTMVQRFFYLNQIQVNQFDVYMIFPLCITKISIGIKTKQNIKKCLYFVLKTNDIFKINFESKKSVATLNYLFKNTFTKQIYIRTNDNCFYLLILSKKNTFSTYQNTSIVQGTRLFGYGNVFFLQNNLIYSKEQMSISLGVFMNFPYKFLKKVRLLYNIPPLIDIRLSPPLLTLATKSNHIRFFIIKHSKIKKEMFFLQIGSFYLFRSNSIFSDLLEVKNKIFIAISDSNFILTCKFTFDFNSNLRKIETCAYTRAIRISFLEWSNFFFSCLLSGEKSHGIVIWNEILIPILKIKIKNSLILNMKFSLKFLGFFLIVTKDSVKNRKKVNRLDRHLLQNTIKLYTSWKKYQSNIFFTLNRVYCLQILKGRIFSLNFENEFDVTKKIYQNLAFYLLLFDFLVKILDKIQKKKLDLSYVSFIYKTIRFNAWFFFFFGHFYVNFTTKKQALCTMRNIGQLRSFSTKEVEIEQTFLCEKNLIKNYSRCKICKRLSRFKFFHKNTKRICQFAHVIPTKMFDFFKNFNQHWFVNLKLNFEFDAKILSHYRINICFDRATKVLFLQKELV
nr:hypothetical protein CparaKRNrm1_p034 [Cryptomonas paramecium]